MAFLHDPISDIQLIANNLRDRYKSGFPVLKEIVQNADDAKAENLILGWHPGIDSASHPLLKDPAIFVINDGSLTEADVKGIRSLGLGSKADDTNAVGKYGLGMKSLFHLGELYFFIGSDWQEYRGDYPKADVLNPWGNVRPNWNDFVESDKREIQTILQTLTNTFIEDAYKFIVWIPLRSQTIARGRGETDNNYIYNGDDFGRQVPDFLTDSNLASHLGQLFPMLKYLKSISGYVFSNADKAFNKLFSTELGRASERLNFPQKTDEAQWHGKIHVHDDVKKVSNKLGYVGTETFLRSESLTRIKGHEFWPVSYARSADGREKKVPDKAEPHSAVVLIKTPAEEQAKLTVRWAVFLPLGDQDTAEEKQVFETNIEGDASFDIYLHGYFFIDAGRVGIHGRKYIGKFDTLSIESEDDATQEWNRFLANNGTLPRLLSTVELATHELKLTLLQQEQMSKGLFRFFNNHLGQNYLRHATSRYQWVYQLSNKDRGWALISVSLKIRSLPTPSSEEYERVWETLPGLRSLAGEVVFIDVGRANIFNSINSSWQDDELAELFKSVPIDVFESPKLLGYLNHFLDGLNIKVKTEACQKVLVDLAQNALRSTELFKHSKNQSAFRTFVDHILPTHRWSVKVEKDEQALWDVFTSIDTSKLFLPAFLDSGDALKTLDYGDADQLFAQLGTATLSDRLLAKATDAILDSLEASEKQNLIKQHDGLKLFTAYVPGRARSYRESSRKLNLLFQSRRLFSQASLSTGQFLLGENLQEALANKDVVFINDRVNQQLFDKRVKACDTMAVLHLLEKKPQLADPESRALLISKLDISSNLGKEQRLSIRYLMHGNSSDKNIAQSLWSVGRDVAVWSRLHKEFLSEDERWTILPHAISSSLRISNEQKNLLNLKEESARSVIDKIGANIQCVDFESVVTSDEDAEEILRFIEDKTLWCSLPLHKTASGELTAIEANCFKKTKLTLPQELYLAISWIESAHSREVQNQQEANIPELNALKAIELALDQSEPAQYQAFIQDMLANVDSKELIFEKLRSVSWLSSGSLPVSPERVIYADRDTWPETFAVSKSSQSICFAEDLEIFETPQFELVKSILVSNEIDIARLALAEAAKLPAYCVGQGKVDSKTLKQASNFRKQFKETGLKGWELLIECCMNVKEEMLGQQWLDDLCQPVKFPESLINVHQALIKESRSAYDIAELRHVLLVMICNQGDALSKLAKLSLRSVNDEYIASERLCQGVTGVAKSAMLHDGDYQAIKHILTKEDECNALNDEYFSKIDHQELDDKAFASSAELIKNYFSDWEPFITNKTAIATLLALMSGTPRIKGICEAYLGQRSYSNFLNEIGRDWVVDNSSHYSHMPESLQKFISKVTFNIQQANEKTTTVTSILNQKIDVELESDLESIFVWDMTRLFYSKPIEIQIRKLPVVEMEEAQLLTILKNDAELFLAKVYQQKLTLDHIWDEFTRAEQLDIRAAKLTVMDGIVYQLKELQLDDPKLSELLKEYDDLVTSAAELHQTVDGMRKEKILERICEQVETESLKVKVLEAVKRKIRQAQYHSHSIPFELFQNADDSVVELKDLGFEDAEINRRGIFRIETTQTIIRFFNWGREVNQYRSVNCIGVKKNENRFKTDLQKMIVRNQSDKGEVVTGKFGLGFKSCLLISDTPHIVSGRLAVQIEGGLLPSISAEHEKLFKLAKHKVLDGGLRPTIISLPLRDDIQPDTVLDRFKKQAGLLTVFSKRIHTIEVGDQQFTWKPKKSVLFEDVSIGTVCLPTPKGHTDVNVIALKTTSGSFAFALRNKGFRTLNPLLPRLWHLSPLMGEFYIGFAINASFDVDIGRNQLAISSKRNSDLFEILGRELSHFFSRLYLRCKSDWDAVKSELSLDETLDVASFWESIWHTLHGGTTRAIRFSDDEGDGNYETYTNKLFTAEGGILSFYRSFQALPSGLKGSEQRLVNLSNVRFRAGELLDNMSKHFERLPEMSNLLEEQKIVGFDVGKTLLAFGMKVEIIDLSDLIERTLGNKYLSPQSADKLSNVFNAGFEQELRNNKATQEQVEQFRNKLSGLNLLVRNGSHRSVKESLILIDCCSSDEAKVIGFAPDEFIVSQQYKTVQKFLEFCRREFRPYNLSKLFDWVCRSEIATDKNKQQLVCRYLVDGELGEELADEIKDNVRPKWVFDIDVKQLNLWGWSKKDIDIFRNVRMVTEEERNTRVEEQLKTEVSSELSPQDALMRVYDWWQSNRDELLPQYEGELYPGGVFNWSTIIKDDMDSIETRKAWLKLLYLGSCQTIGRTREVQHKGAVEWFENNGWWDVFAVPDKANADSWFKVIDEYLDYSLSKEQYRNWLQLLPIYRFSRDLDDYIELLWSSEQFLENLDDLLSTSASAALEGTGMSVPDLKATLGIGINFIFRELVRHKVLDIDNLKRFSYVPSLKVREFLTLIQCPLIEDTWAPYQSSKIYHFIEKQIGDEFATFSGSFDIPFRILMKKENSRLRNELLGIELYE